MLKVSNCQNCGKRFTMHISKHRLSRGLGGKFCSRKCFKESMKLGKNINWKGDNATMDTARQRISQKDSSSYLSIPNDCERHHKDGNPFNNTIDNVQIVTRREHMILDGRLNRRDVEGKFRGK